MKPIAICSCHAHFYNTYDGWTRMNAHITDNNKAVHRWTYVPDLIICKEIEDADQESDTDCLL